MAILSNSSRCVKDAQRKRIIRQRKKKSYRVKFRLGSPAEALAADSSSPRRDSRCRLTKTSTDSPPLYPSSSTSFPRFVRLLLLLAKIPSTQRPACYYVTIKEQPLSTIANIELLILRIYVDRMITIQVSKIFHIDILLISR